MNKTPLLALTLAIAGGAGAASTYKIANFKSTGAQDGDRSFVSTGFVGSAATLNASNIGYFGDATLTAGGKTYGWNDAIAGDFGGGNQYAVNPDRGVAATPFAGEAGTPKSGTLREVFGSNNLGYLLDSEDNSAWTLNMTYKGGGYVTAGASSGPELMMLERGANSQLGVRAILAGGLLSSAYVMDFSTTGSGQAALADYSLSTTEIAPNRQDVSGLGLGLDAFGLATGTRVYGYQFYANSTFNGPDFVGFVAGKTAPVPEPGTIAALGFGALGIVRRRMKRA